MNTLVTPQLHQANAMPNSYPGNLSPDNIKQLYAKWQLLKSQGATESNHSEFAQYSAILRSITQQQQNSHARKQQMEQQRQMQQNRMQGQTGQMPPQTMNGAVAPQMNGARPVPNVAGTPNKRSTMPPTTTTRPDATVNTNGSALNLPATPSKQTAPGPNSSFTQDQLAILRNQIVAYKMISKNQVLPPHILNSIISPSSALMKTPPPAAPAPTPSVDAAVKEGTVEKTDSPSVSTRSGYETFTSPYSLYQAPILHSEHASRDRRPLIPSIMPSGIEIDKLREERERVIYNRIMARKAELESLPANLGEYDAGSGPTAGQVTDSLKLKALIEYKSICLLQKQRALRQEMVQNLLHMDNLAMTSNRAMYRKMKKQSLREARITEKLEKQQREQREKRERQKHQDYLQSVTNHSREILANLKTGQSKAQKLGRMMISHHQNMEKEEQKRVERTAKQRLQALKSNNEEEYLKLLDQAKDTRITHLLKQTDGFLNSLAQAVRTQQKDAVQQYGRPEGYVSEESEDEEEEDDDEEDKEKKIDYYTVAHRIQETVTKQPDILVGGKLKEYQIKGLQWMVSLYNNNLNGILADEMGLGKTIQTISLVTHLIQHKKVTGPFLVIVPLTTLTNWVLEFEKWAPSIKKIVYKGPPLARKSHQNAVRQGDFQALLTTYEFIIRDRPVLSKVRWAYMIVDEGHRMKNSESKLSFTLTTYYTCRYRLILTGTPLQNNLPELWALLNFVLPNIFKSVKSFDEWFNTPFANTGGQDKMELSEEEALLVIRRLHKVLRPFLLRRLKKDVESELPDKVEKIIKCKFSALQTKLYNQMKTNGMMFVADAKQKSGKQNIKGLSNMLMQLRKICNHPFVFEEVERAISPESSINDLLWRSAGKFELLDRLLPKFFVTGHRVLMFFQMTQIMNIMEDFCLYRGWKYMRLDGSTKADDRSLLLKDFNAPGSEYQIFLLSTRAGGLGLNLQTADTVVIYDSDWNPHQDLQAQDRAHRIGQKNEVRILRLITSNSVEEKILARAQYKLDIDGKVIQAGKFDNKSKDEDRDALLRSLLEVDDTEKEEDEEYDDDELNEICARSEEEIAIFKKMDEDRLANSQYGKDRGQDRLMGDDELPAVYLQEDITEVVEELAPAGRGARERTQVKYDDGLTEEQWLDAIDDDNDTIEDAIQRKRDAVAKRNANKSKRADSVEDVTPPPPESPAESEPPSTKRKRGRTAKAEKRKAVEEIIEEPKRKRPRGKNAMSDPLTNTERSNLQKVLNKLYTSCIELPEAPDSDRKCSEHFVVLPSKKFYPDYYQFIKRPTSFQMIEKKIQREDYLSLNEAKEDFMTMFQNARIYNEEGSVVYEDANAMEEEFRTKVTSLAKKYDLDLDLEDPDNNNNDAANSNGATSSTQPSTNGTPAATAVTTTPNIYLKLKVNPKAKEPSIDEDDSDDANDDDDDDDNSD